MFIFVGGSPCRYTREMAESLFQPFPMLSGRRAQAWRHQPAYRRPRHFHAEPELNIVFRGSAVIGLGDGVVRAHAGDVVLFHPGQDHELLEASAELQLFVVALRPEVAERACSPLARASSHGCRLTTSDLSSVEDQLGALGAVVDGNAVEEQLASLFQEVQGKLSTNHVLSRRALQEISAHPETSGSDLAERLGVDPSVLSRHFHEDLGLTFVSYRARQRAMTFVRLVDSGQSLTRASQEAGFGSYAQCHRVITRALGCAPHKYFAGERSRIDQAIEPRT
jgi:AraC-like DNA-binding protein/mannose-6-phosphate isomerase-like protein (cupin superfamily)